MKAFQIILEKLGLGGYCREYWKSNFPTFGNKNEAGRMRNMDLRNPHYILPGPYRTRLTNGDNSGAVTTLMRTIMKTAVGSGDTYAIGGDKVYQISGDTITNAGSFPQTLPAGPGGLGPSPAGEDIKKCGTYLYYTFRQANRGMMGMLQLPNTFDHDFLINPVGPPFGTFTLEYGVPLPIEYGSDGIVYIGNGNKVSTYDTISGVAVQDTVLLPTDSVVTDIKYNDGRLVITANYPNLTGANRVAKALFFWNTVDRQWDYDVPEIKRGGGMFKKEGVIFVFYEDVTSAGESSLGYLDGSQIKELIKFEGSLPQYYQIDEVSGFIVWVSRVGSEDLIYAFGSGDSALPSRFFQLMKGHHEYIDGIGAPFGKILVASGDGGTTKYNISKEDGYETDSYFKGMLFEISLDERMGVVRKITVDTEVLTGGTTKFSLRNAKNVLLDYRNLSFPVEGGIVKKIWNMVKRSENVRVELDYSKGGTTSYTPVKKIEIDGFSVK